MSTQQTMPVTGVCSRCGECCRWLPVASVRECSPRLRLYYRERGLKESGGMFLADAPCRHLQKENEDPAGNPAPVWICMIHEKRPATCRDYCGKTRNRGTEYYVPEDCTMAGGCKPAPMNPARKRSPKSRSPVPA